jgi:hypothetical protein
VRARGPEDLATPTLPGECAILMGLPISYDQFKSDVAAYPKRGHYAWTICQQYCDVDEAWHRVGKDIGDLALQLLDTAKTAGARVFCHAGLASLEEAASHHSVLVVVGHWRRPELHSSDLKVSVKRFLDTATDQCTPFLNWFVHELGADVRERVARFDDESDRKAEFVSLVNERVLAQYPSFARLTADARLEDTFWWMTIAREKLEEAFPNQIWVGNVLELRDGYHKAETVRDCLPGDWSGVIDLAVCSSEYLAMIVKAERDYRRVILNRGEKYPARCLRELIETFLRLPQERRNYVPIRADVFGIYSRLERSARSECTCFQKS